MMEVAFSDAIIGMPVTDALVFSAGNLIVAVACFWVVALLAWRVGWLPIGAILGPGVGVYGAMAWATSLDPTLCLKASLYAATVMSFWLWINSSKNTNRQSVQTWTLKAIRKGGWGSVLLGVIVILIHTSKEKQSVYEHLADTDRPGVVLITLDTTRLDAVTPFGDNPTPNIATFGEQSVVFSQASRPHR